MHVELAGSTSAKTNSLLLKGGQTSDRSLLAQTAHFLTPIYAQPTPHTGEIANLHGSASINRKDKN